MTGSNGPDEVFVVDEAVAQAIESACQEILDAGGVEKTAETALDTVVNYVFNSLDEGHYEDIALNNNYDLTEDDWTEDDVREGLVATIGDFVTGPVFADSQFRVYRAIRVTCPPDEVRQDGTAADIGICWSTSEHIADPDFLSQYGEDGGRDVRFVADITRDDVDWLETVAARCNPWIGDYCEIDLRADARPRIVSVFDPGENPEPSVP